jgi:hypothetical protein
MPLQSRICGRERHMKARIMLGVLVVMLGTAFGMATFDGGPEPLCRPGSIPCSAAK